MDSHSLPTEVHLQRQCKVYPGLVGGHTCWLGLSVEIRFANHTAISVDWGLSEVPVTEHDGLLLIFAITRGNGIIKEHNTFCVMGVVWGVVCSRRFIVMLLEATDKPMATDQWCLSDLCLVFKNWSEPKAATWIEELVEGIRINSFCYYWHWWTYI